MALDPSAIVSRLAYIRYLHHLGVEQAHQPEPLSSAAVLLLHDAAESFLMLAGEHLGAPSTYEFEKYWDALSPKKLRGGVDLTVQQGMKRLNRARVLLKHHGGHPSAAAIRQMTDDTATFLAANTTAVFRLDYQALSMASLIPQEKVRDLAVKADEACRAGDHQAAMIALVDAWAELFEPWPPTPAVEEKSPLLFGPTIRNDLRDYDVADYLRSEEGSRRHPRLNEDIGRQLAELSEAVAALQAAARLGAVGVDFAAYQRFRSLTPHRSDYYRGRREYRAPIGYAPTSDDVAFCLQLVVTASRRLAAAEGQLVDAPWVDRDRWWQMKWEIILSVSGRDSE